MEGYGLQTKIPEKAGESRTSAKPIAPAQDEEDTEAAAGKATWHPMATPPLGLFFKGTFLFPFTVRARVWHFILLIFGCGAAAGVLLAMYFAGFSGGMEIADKWIASMVLTSFSIIIGAFGILVASAICLTVMRETSEGMHKFKDQQIGWFTDWFEEAVYLAANLFFGAGPAVILVLILPVRPAMKLPIYLFSEIFLFPLFLMSALECKSAVTPYSKAVWKSLCYAWHTWVLFYLLTLLIGETFVYLLRVIPFGGIEKEVMFMALVLPFH